MPQGCHEKRQDLVLDNIPLLSFMKRCGENFREILGGRKDPRQIMFPGGNPDAVESIYQDTPQSRYYNGIMARSLKALADALPMDRALSILEIGAGTGGTTSALLPVLPAGRTRYVYTDVSPCSRPGPGTASPPSPLWNMPRWTSAATRSFRASMPTSSISSSAPMSCTPLPT